MKKIAAHTLVLCLLSGAVYAQATTAAQQDVVETMRKTYADAFKDLPPSRKCTPDDAKGAWKEVAIFESGATTETAAQEKSGPKYVAFGPYNRLFIKRMKKAPKANRLNSDLPKAKHQYIVTSAGMLYVYEGQQVQNSWLCFMSTQANPKYSQGMLMIAHAVEKDKPLVLGIYAPFGKK